MGFGVFALIGLVFNLIFPTLIGGVLLRAAVALYNKFHPSYQQDDSPEAASSEDHQNEVAPAAQVAVQETDNPYATPQTIAVAASAARTVAIPEPAYLEGMWDLLPCGDRKRGHACFGCCFFRIRWAGTG